MLSVILILMAWVVDMPLWLSITTTVGAGLVILSDIID